MYQRECFKWNIWNCVTIDGLLNAYWFSLKSAGIYAIWEKTNFLLINISINIMFHVKQCEKCNSKSTFLPKNAIKTFAFHVALL